MPAAFMSFRALVTSRRSSVHMRLITVVLSGGAGIQAHQPKAVHETGCRTLLEQAIARGQACGSDDLLVVTPVLKNSAG